MSWHRRRVGSGGDWGGGGSAMTMNPLGIGCGIESDHVQLVTSEIAARNSLVLPVIWSEYTQDVWCAHANASTPAVKLRGKSEKYLVLQNMPEMPKRQSRSQSVEQMRIAPTSTGGGHAMHIKDVD
eukprot:4667842-Prymnesium_polylepis.4